MINQLRSELTGNDCRCIAIDGCGGSGKSTVAAALADGWTGATIVHLDDFYRPVDDRPNDPSIIAGNWDLQRFVRQVLEPHSLHKTFMYDRYDWDSDTIVPGDLVGSNDILIVEGLYSSSQTLRLYYDYIIWVETPREVRLERGIERDGEGMRDTWVNVWMKAEDVYSQTNPAKWADRIIDGTVRITE